MRSQRLLLTICVGSAGMIALAPPAIAETPTVRSNFERGFYVPAPLSTDTRTPVTAPQPPEDEEVSNQSTKVDTEVDVEVSPAVKAPFTNAQTQAPPSEPTPGSAPPSEPPPPVFGPRIGVRYNNEGAGTQQFVGFETFLPLFQRPAQSISFVEGRALYDPENRTFGGNVLLGYRTLNPTNNRILGGYLAYDNRDTGNSFFHQIGIGAESLGEDWDARVNAYIPVSNTRNQLAELFSPGFFRQNSLLINRLQVFEAAMAGFDAEYGRKLLSFGRSGSLRGYLGFYYYAGNGGDSAVGGRVRVAARINDYASVGLALQHDSLFDTQAVVNVALNFPTSGPQEGSVAAPIVTRLGGTVERTPGITVDEQRQRDTVVALNPTTRQPWRFIHVNLGGAGGNGTIESPYGSFTDGLSTASAGSVVYVQSGTNPGLASFTIPQGVQVLSAGPQQTLTVQQLGRQTVLPNSGTGVYPTVNGTVTLSSDTGIGGFTINPGAAVGITGQNIQNIRISDNLITNPGQTVGQGGINLRNVIGDVVIARNTVTFPAIPAESVTTIVATPGVLTPVRESCGGICFTADPYPADFEIAGGSSGIRLFNDSGTTNLTVISNTVSNAVSNGILLGSGGSARTIANISFNNASNNQGSGIFIPVLGDSQYTAVLDSNIINSNQGRIVNESGVRFAGFDNARLEGTLINNTANGNTGNGLFFAMNDNSLGIATIRNNTASNNIAGNGIFIGSRVNASVNAIVSNNTTFGNQFSTTSLPPGFPTGNGIVIGALENGIANATLVDNTANSNQSNGIYFLVAENGRGNGNIFNNITNNNTRSGILADIGVVPPGSTTPSPPVGTVQGTLNILNNTAINNLGFGATNQGGGGITVRTFSNAVARVTLQGNYAFDNSFDPSAFAGIGLLSLDNSQLLVTAQFNNTLGGPDAVTGSSRSGGFVAQSVGNSTMCLRWNNNTSDSPILLVRVPNSTLQAETTGNAGPPVVTALLPVLAIGTCSTP